MPQTPTPHAPPAVAAFDVNETLSDLGGLAPRLERAGVDPALLPLWFASTLRDGFALTAAGGYASFSEIAVPTLQAILTSAGVAAGETEQLAEQTVQAMAELDLHPDVTEGLERLHAAGVRIVTLSNGSQDVAESLLGRAGLLDLVEACLSVSDAGRWKPARDAYAHAASRCQVEPHEIALIAVHPWDVDGALRAGLRAGWLARKGDPYPAYLRAPETIGQTLPELVESLLRPPAKPS